MELQGNVSVTYQAIVKDWPDKETLQSHCLKYMATFHRDSSLDAIWMFTIYPR